MTKGYINITDIKEFHKQIMTPKMERMKFMKKFKYFLLTGMLLASAKKIQKNAQSVNVPPAMKIRVSCIIPPKIPVITSIEKTMPALISLQIFLAERLFSFISFRLLSIDNPYRKPF